MSSEHVEVLRNLSEVCRAAIKAGDWKVDGACDPDSLLRHADAAIASLSAPQPPAEAQPVAWEWEYIGGDHYTRGHKVARSLCEMDPKNPPYPEIWRPTRPLIYGDTAPPSAPVGVAADILRIVDTAIDVCNDRDRPAMAEDLEAVRLYVEQASAPLAQQPATETGPAPCPVCLGFCGDSGPTCSERMEVQA